MIKQEYEPQGDLIDKSEAFQNGFECGIIWHALKNGGSFIGHPIKTENSAQIKMFCDVLHIECKINVAKFPDNSWSELTTHGMKKEELDFLDDLS